jgi:transcriptional regulator with XRE-family HTH domain
MNLSEEIALRLQMERKRLGLSQSEMCELAGVSRAAQSNYEVGKSTPDLIYGVHAAAAGMDIGYVMTDIRESVRAAETLDWKLASDLIIAIHIVAAELKIKLTPDMIGPLLKILYELAVKKQKPNSLTDTTREVLKIANWV